MPSPPKDMFVVLASSCTRPCSSWSWAKVSIFPSCGRWLASQTGQSFLQHSHSWPKVLAEIMRKDQICYITGIPAATPNLLIAIAKLRLSDRGKESSNGPFRSSPRYQSVFLRRTIIAYFEGVIRWSILSTSHQRLCGLCIIYVCLSVRVWRAYYGCQTNKPYTFWIRKTSGKFWTIKIHNIFGLGVYIIIYNKNFVPFCFRRM